MNGPTTKTCICSLQVTLITFGWVCGFYTFVIFTVSAWIHETRHGLAALFEWGYGVDKLEPFPDASGLTEYHHFVG